MLKVVENCTHKIESIFTGCLGFIVFPVPFLMITTVSISYQLALRLPCHYLFILQEQYFNMHSIEIVQRCFCCCVKKCCNGCIVSSGKAELLLMSLNTLRRLKICCSARDLVDCWCSGLSRDERWFLLKSVLAICCVSLSYIWIGLQCPKS